MAATQTIDEVTEAREATAARLERLARRIRESETTDMTALDEAYSDIVKLAGRVRIILSLP